MAAALPFAPLDDHYDRLVAFYGILRFISVSSEPDVGD
jgi:hypothetical protein